MAAMLGGDITATPIGPTLADGSRHILVELLPAARQRVTKWQSALQPQAQQAERLTSSSLDRTTVDGCVVHLVLALALRDPQKLYEDLRWAQVGSAAREVLKMVRWSLAVHQLRTAESPADSRCLWEHMERALTGQTDLSEEQANKLAAEAHAAPQLLSFLGSLSLDANGTAARRAAEAMSGALAGRDRLQGEEARTAAEEADQQVERYLDRCGDVRPTGTQGRQEGFCNLGEYPWS